MCFANPAYDSPSGRASPPPEPSPISEPRSPANDRSFRPHRSPATGPCCRRISIRSRPRNGWRRFDAIIENEGRERATFILRKLLDHARAQRVPLPPVLSTPYCNTISLADQPQFPGNLEIEQRADRHWCAGTRWPWWCARTTSSSELGGHIASYASAADLFEVGFNHFFRAGQAGRSHLLPAAFGARRVRARLSRRTAERRAARQLPPRGRRQGPVVLLPSVADAGLLAISDRLDGAGPAHGDLSGALHALSREPRHPRDAGPQGVGFVGDGEMDEPESLAGLSLAAREGPRQSDLRGELQPAAPRRPGARQRLDHPGARRPVRRRRLERDQAAVGLGLGSAVRARPRQHHPQAPARDGRRRIPEVRRHRRPLQPRALLQQVSRAAGHRRAHVRRRHRPAAARRPRPGEDLRRLSRGGESQGPAHRHSGADQEGLRHGQLGPGQDGGAPAEEARGRSAARIPRPLRAAAVERGRARSCASTSRPPTARR